MADYRIRITRITNTNRDDDQVLYGGIAQGAGNAVLVLLAVAEDIRVTMNNDERIETDCRVSETVMGQPVVDRSWPCNFDAEGYGLEAEASRYAKGDPYPVFATWKGGWPPDKGGVADVTPVPNYSTDIAAAWQVVEHLAGQGWQLLLLRLCDGTTEATFSNQLGVRCQAQAGTVSLAICQAALSTTPE